MPFTLAHPAAAVPLCRRFGKYGVLSALVIGSMTPDMHYLLPFVARKESHSLAGLFWFCLPAGLFSYGLFHLALKQPFLLLLPSGIAERLAPHVRTALPEVPRAGVLISLLSGALTHLAWDALTHGDNFGFRSLDFLDTVVFSLGSHPVHVCDLLQGASSVIGVWLLFRWSIDWLHSARPETVEIAISARERSLILFLVAFFGLAALLAAGGSHPGEDALSILSSRISAAMIAVMIPLVGYGLLWHVARLRRA